MKKQTGKIKKSIVRPKPTSADGVRGCLIRDLGGNVYFRVYDENHSFKDYDIFHNDLFVTIDDKDAFFYESDKRKTLDHSPQTLGYEDADEQ